MGHPYIISTIKAAANVSVSRMMLTVVLENSFTKYPLLG